MTDINPYETPKSEPKEIDLETVLIERVATGQKLVIWAILVNITATALQVAVNPLFGLLGLVALVMSVFGVIKLSSGLGSALWARLIYVLLMILPLVNLITLLILNGRATKVLRANGYKVGLMGASKKD